MYMLGLYRLMVVCRGTQEVRRLLGRSLKVMELRWKIKTEVEQHRTTNGRLQITMKCKTANCPFYIPYLLLFSWTPWDGFPAFQGGLLSSLLWVSVPVKLDMGHSTACHYTATAQTRWTCLRQGPEREFGVRKQWRSWCSPIQEIQF